MKENMRITLTGFTYNDMKWKNYDPCLNVMTFPLANEYSRYLRVEIGLNFAIKTTKTGFFV